MKGSGALHPPEGPEPQAPTPPPGNLLCVANFPANTGFAWTFIEGLFAGLAGRLSHAGVSTWVAYPEVPAYPETLRDAPAEPLELAVDLDAAVSLRTLIREVRRRNIRALYLCDRPSWHGAYAVLRMAGVRTIVVHDHSSGARVQPGPLKAWIKRAVHRLPGGAPDRVLAVSDFVARRLREVNGCPAEQVVRIWNSVDVPETLASPDRRAALLRAHGVDPDRPVVGCASRATRVKGVFELLRAFDRIWTGWSGAGRPQLLYMGDGPDLGALRDAWDALPSRDAMVLAGYTPAAAEVLGAVDVAVVPSLWEEAFGLAALEPLARGVPVVASRVGGIPEIVDHEESGLLVAPGDEEALAAAVTRLLADPVWARSLGERGRARALRDFDRPVQLDALEGLFRREMGI